MAESLRQEDADSLTWRQPTLMTSVMSAHLPPPPPSILLSVPTSLAKSEPISSSSKLSWEDQLKRSVRMGGLVVPEDLELIKKHRQARLQREAALKAP